MLFIIPFILLVGYANYNCFNSENNQYSEINEKNGELNLNNLFKWNNNNNI